MDTQKGELLREPSTETVRITTPGPSSINPHRANDDEPQITYARVRSTGVMSSRHRDSDWKVGLAWGSCVGGFLIGLSILPIPWPAQFSSPANVAASATWRAPREVRGWRSDERAPETEVALSSAMPDKESHLLAEPEPKVTPIVEAAPDAAAAIVPVMDESPHESQEQRREAHVERPMHLSLAGEVRRVHGGRIRESALLHALAHAEVGGASCSAFARGKKSSATMEVSVLVTTSGQAKSISLKTPKHARSHAFGCVKEILSQARLPRATGRPTQVVLTLSLEGVRR